MGRDTLSPARHGIFLLGALVFIGLYLTSLYSYLLFHSLAELFSVAVACSIFMIVWNSRRFLDNGYLLFIGIAYLFVGFLDLLHTLAYKGMGVFPPDGNLATQLWIAARYMQSISLFIAPLFLKREVRTGAVAAVYSGVILFLLLSLFYWPVFPVCFIEGAGLTPFKKVSEYVISLILVGSITQLVRNRRYFDTDVFNWIVFSIIMTIVSELAFTFYVSVYGLSNLIGHFVKIAAFFFIYKAIVEIGLTRPYDLLFRNLKHAEQELQRAHNELEIRVQERTAELKRQGEELKRLVAAVEQTGEAVFIMNPDFTIRYVNPAFTRLTGYSWEEIIGKDVSVLRSDKRPESFYEKIKTTVSSGLQWSDVYPLRHKDGVILAVRSHVSSIRDEDGAIAHYVVVCHDISEQQKLEAQLRQSQKMEALGTLTGGIAHDFNNILAAMIGFAELAADRVRKGSREAHFLQRVLEGGIRARDLIKQMLIFSRKTEQEKKPLQLSSAINETMNLLRASTPSTIRVEVNVKSESGLILGDPVQLQQVVMNLCTNAVFAMRKKGGVLEIELSDFSVSRRQESAPGLEPGLYMRLRVRDTGMGIPPEIMEKIFDPFFTTKKHDEGTGLGLSVVHGIVKQHGGHIAVESTPGIGTVFDVYFPKVAVGREDDPVQDDHAPRGNERILLVDDEEALAEMGQQLLHELGYEVTVKTSSTDALALFESHPENFDLMITDQTMPEITGLELAREVIRIRPDLPVVLTTGFSHAVKAGAAEEAGIRAFVMKPVTKRELARTLREVLDGKRADGETRRP